MQLNKRTTTWAICPMLSLSKYSLIEQFQKFFDLKRAHDGSEHNFIFDLIKIPCLGLNYSYALHTGITSNLCIVMAAHTINSNKTRPTSWETQREWVPLISSVADDPQSDILQEWVWESLHHVPWSATNTVSLHRMSPDERFLMGISTRLEKRKKI